jgi:hypothetical protein
MAATAGANGRDPYTSSIHWKRGAEQNVVAGMTFGLVISHDGGATWQWMCEKAVGYGGMYDPDYEYTSSGAIFATTFDGLKVMRDGCSFASTPPGMTFVSRVEQATDGTVYFAAADPNDAKIYKSTDDGVTFPTSASPGLPNDWWQSIEVAPSDPTVVYLTGYRLVMKCTPNSGNPGAACTTNTDCTSGGMCEPQKEFLLFKSGNSGTTFTPMSQLGGTTSANSTIDIVGISPTNPQTLYVKVTLETGSVGDSIYRTMNGGTSWTKILSKSSNFGLAFLIRSDGSCVAGTREMGAWKAANCSTVTEQTWTTLAGAPHIGCLYENAAHEVWACTQNTAIPQLGLDGDNYGIMKSTDLATWTGVLKYQEIQAPVPCAAGTVQDDQCVERYMDMQSPWCCLVPQLGITSTAIDCTGPRGCFATPDGAVDAGTNVNPPKDTCGCDAEHAPGALLGGLVVGGLLFRRKRPRTRRKE